MASTTTYVCPVCYREIKTIFGGLSSTLDNHIHHDDSGFCLGSIEFFKDQVNMESTRGNTPLRFAILSYNNHQDMSQKNIEDAVRMLLENGADPNFRGEVGLSKNVSSAYDFALSKNMTRITQIFEEYAPMIKEPSDE